MFFRTEERGYFVLNQADMGASTMADGAFQEGLPRSRRNSNPTHPRYLLWILFGVVATLLLVPVVFVLIVLIGMANSNGKGSPEEAERLRVSLEAIADPESGEGCHSEYAAKRFKNGEWVLGIGRDSHAWLSSTRGGGTIVVKDSRGQVRCFFGHVCGHAGHEPFMEHADSLERFYTSISEAQLSESKFP